jgi:signal transduction histidine kinase
MSILNYVLITIVFILTILLLSAYKKIKDISKVLDSVLQGNANSRIRLQSHIKPINTLAIKINNLCKRLQETVEQNKRTEESRKKMISNISHDLRTPLTSMLGYMEIIVHDTTLIDSEKEEYTKIVYNKGMNLLSLMEEFFQVSKLDSKDIKLEITKVNVSELIRENIASFFSEFKKYNIEPEIILQNVDIYAFGDEKAINRILSNLINNAFKYGKEASVIGIGVWEGADNISVKVWDNGEGIPEEDICYIFDRLYTVDKSRRSNSKSSGLGLTIVKKLVANLGGTITVASIPFEKTTFTFTLPKHILQ